MALLDRIQEGFSFDLSDIQDELNDLSPDAPAVNLEGTESAVGPLKSLDLGSLTETVSNLAGQSLSGLTDLQGSDGPFAQVTRLLENAEGLTDSSPVQVLESLEQQFGDNTASGLQRLSEAFGQLESLGQQESIESLFRLISTFAGGAVDLGQSVPSMAGKARAILQLVEVLSTLMVAESTCRRARDTGAKLDELLPPDRNADTEASLQAWFEENSLVDRIRFVDPHDAARVDQLADDVKEYLTHVSEYTGFLQRGLGFGEGTLRFAGISDAVNRYEAAAVRLRDNQALDPVREMSVFLQESLMSRLPAQWSEIRSPVDQLAQALSDHIGEWTAGIQSADVTQLTQPVTGAIGSLTSVIRTVNDALDQASALFRALTKQVRDLISGLNLESLAETIRAVIRPVAEALDKLAELLGASMAAINTAMTTATAAIETAKAAVLNKADELKSTFDTVANELQAALDKFDTVVGGIQQGVDSVTQALRKIQLDPIFETAVDAMNTASDVVDAVPMDIVPDDIEADLKEAVKPIREIDYDKVRSTLKTQMDGILESLDTDVLGEVQTLFENLIKFLRDNHPREALETLEAEVFDAMLERLRAIDPEELLKPVQEVVDDAKGLVAGLDLNTEFIKPLDDAFDQVLAYYDELDPSALLEPIATKLGTVRQDIKDALGIDEWPRYLDGIVEELERLLGRLNLQALIPKLDGVFDTLLADLRAQGKDGPGLGLLVANLSPEPGADPAAYKRICGWIQGEDGAGYLSEILQQALERARGARAKVAALDLAPIAARSGSFHRSLTEALEAHSGTPLHQRLAPVLNRFSPEERFAPLLANKPRYLQELDRQIAALETLSGSGFSEITTVSAALRDALRPLDLLRAHFADLLRAFGIQDLSLPLMEILADIFSHARPKAFLEPFIPLLDAIKAKVMELVEDGLVEPLKTGIQELIDLLDALDIQPYVDELSTIHADLRAELTAFRPGTLLAEPMSALTGLKEQVEQFDPLAPVRVVVDEFKAAVDELAGEKSPLRPTVMLKSLLEVYDDLLDKAGTLDVQEILKPVLDELGNLANSLDEGLGSSEEAFLKLQQTLGKIGA